jgi:hypothetical protein
LGDFWQAGPIVNGTGHTASLAASVKSSVLWNHIHIFTLNTPIQSMGDPRFTVFIDRISEDSSENRHLVLIAATTNFDDTIHLPHVLQDVETCLQRAFLPPLDVYIDETKFRRNCQKIS